MQFQMPVTLVGGMSFQPDSGNRINQIFVLNCDPSSDMYRGFVPAKISADQALVDSLSKDLKDYPRQVLLTVINKTQGGKTVQHALNIVPDSSKKAV